MVAPTRAPQARGVKCDLCRKILALATWLDQTKLAKTVDEPRKVLDLIQRHEKSQCPCIPKNILNLLCGSTHFEIHRLLINSLDALVSQRQTECSNKFRHKALKEAAEQNKNKINDCSIPFGISRFKIYPRYDDRDVSEKFEQQLEQLCRAIDYWRDSMIDVANPFNAKLALRLGLTHHVIYACYLFKFYKLLDYQLRTANLLLFVFKSIEGVTVNAQMHANFLLIKTLMDCDQYQLAQDYLDEAIKVPNFQDKTLYESILLACVSCELGLIRGRELHVNLDDLVDLAKIRPDDKLQHYYARTLALSIIIKYIQCYPARSENCFEFFHAFKLLGAIMRRCYESAFELVLAEKDIKIPTKTTTPQRHQQSVMQLNPHGHAWIKLAICDFTFSTFHVLSYFYIRSGLPENLELVYNALNLISYRNGSTYWQAKMAAIGIDMDCLCDKLDFANHKLDVMKKITKRASKTTSFDGLIRLDYDLHRIELPEGKSTALREVSVGFFKHTSQELLQHRSRVLDSLAKIELYDCSSDNIFRLTELEHGLVTPTSCWGALYLRLFKVTITSLVKLSSFCAAKELHIQLAKQVAAGSYKTIDYNGCQCLLEALMHCADVEASEELLLEAVCQSELFLGSNDTDCLSAIGSQLSLLTIATDDEPTIGDSGSTLPRSKPKWKQPKQLTSSLTKSIMKHSKRRGLYEVAARSEESLGDQRVRHFDTLGALQNGETLTKEEIVEAYLRNSEPNPDFQYYRRAHELMLSIRLREMSAEKTLGHELGLLLFHLGESTSANTMRYRWMMYDEHHLTPFDTTKAKAGERDSSTSPTKNLSFSNVLVNQEKLVRQCAKIIPDDYRLVHLKFVHNRSAGTEHLIAASFDAEMRPALVHVSKPTHSSCIFFDDSHRRRESKTLQPITLPEKLFAKTEESKRVLLSKNSAGRSDTRRAIESDIEVILSELQDDLLGPFRILLLAKVRDQAYVKFVGKFTGELLAFMGRDSRNGAPVNTSALALLNIVVEQAPDLSRDEFCQLLGHIFNCPASATKTRDAFNLWMKAFESHLSEQQRDCTVGPLDKHSYWRSLARGQLGLILDRQFELMPVESLPSVRLVNQGMFRVPSMRLFGVLMGRQVHPIRADVAHAAYLLDPANNLSKTRKRFEEKLRKQTAWQGTIGEPPDPDQLGTWLDERQMYLFIGHGAGTVYYNKLCKCHGLGAMVRVRPVCILMGCSSGRVSAEGPRLESFGVNWIFVFRGAPACVGLLWDVTDTDIDRFLDSLLANWINVSRHSSSPCSLAEAAAKARRVCQLKCLIGATPVVYGLPVWCQCAPSAGDEEGTGTSGGALVEWAE